MIYPFVVVALAASLGACGLPNLSIQSPRASTAAPLVQNRVVLPKVARECIPAKKLRQWKQLPVDQQGAKLQDVALAWNENKRAYLRLANKSDTCAASLRAQGIKSR